MHTLLIELCPHNTKPLSDCCSWSHLHFPDGHHPKIPSTLGKGGSFLGQGYSIVCLKTSRMNQARNSHVHFAACCCKTTPLDRSSHWQLWIVHTVILRISQYVSICIVHLKAQITWWFRGCPKTVWPLSSMEEASCLNFYGVESDWG